MGMKNTKERILLIIIGILLITALALLILFVINKGNDDKFKESYEKIETNLNENLIYLTSGYATDYAGSEKLFENKSTTIKKLPDENKLAYIVNILIKNEEIEDVDDSVYANLSEKLNGKDDYLLIKGETIKNKMNELLNIDWKHKSIESKDGFIYNFEYIESEDVYLITPSESFNEYEEKVSNSNKSIVTYALESRSTSKTVKTTIAVAYIEYVEEENGNTIIKYYSDAKQENLVFEVNSKDLYIINDNGETITNKDADSIKNHSDKFVKYVVTSVSNGDNFSIDNIKRK